MQAPEAGTGAIFVDRFHVEIALTGPWCRTNDFREQVFRRRITIENTAFTAFLVIDHELHGNARAARPLGVGNISAIANEIAGICIFDHRKSPLKW